MRIIAFITTLVVSALAAGSAATPIPNPQSGIRNPATDAITIPRMLSYQGKLTDGSGGPVADTTYSVLFSLYSMPSGGSSMWSETQTVRTKLGLFAVLLGSVSPIGTLPEAGTLYLGMKVGADPEMTPRIQIASAAYAYLASKADTANYALAAGGASGSTWVRGTPDSVLYTVNRLGIARGGSSNMLYGSFRQSHVNFGVSCTTGASGQDYSNATVGGGLLNTARAGYSTVGGGWANRANGVGSAVAGGAGNLAGGDYSAVIGGFADSTLGLCGGALSGYLNKAGATASDTCAVIAGGYQNRALGPYSVVGGGRANVACSSWTTVAGGQQDSAIRPYATVGGGERNRAQGSNAVIGGGRFNQASGYCSAVGGGDGNTASGSWAFVGAGNGNQAVGPYASVTAGELNYAAGRSAAIPCGIMNRANGCASLAAGLNAHANHAGSFVWGDSAFYVTDTISTTGNNQWRVRARGGTWFFSNLAMTTGAYLAPGSNAWTSACDSANKEDFRPVDRKALLDKVAALRVRNYKMKDQDDGTRHIGPVAQDFHDSFGVGETSTGINMADADGVALAAIQALIEKNQALSKRVAELEAKMNGR
jgi:hypothetical protein